MSNPPTETALRPGAPPSRPRAWLRPRLRIAALVLVVGGIGAFAIWRGVVDFAGADRPDALPAPAAVPHSH